MRCINEKGGEKHHLKDFILFDQDINITVNEFSLKKLAFLFYQPSSKNRDGMRNSTLERELKLWQIATHRAT